MEGDEDVEPAEEVAEHGDEHAELHEAVGGMGSRILHHMNNSHDDQHHADRDHCVEVENKAPFSSAV
jgi:hypothetical protein